MKWMKTLLIAFALVVGTTGLAAAQEGYNGQNRSWDRDGDRDRNRNANRNGNRAGRWGYQDRDHDRNGAYQRRRGDGDRDDGYRNNRSVYGPYNQGVYGPYNQGPYNQNPYYNTGIQQAQQNGYQWGLRDGQVDRQAGRSYRAISNETYRNATIGYVSAYGDKNQYKSVFRQAYEQGYQRGYGAGGYGGPYGQYGPVPWGR